MKTKIKKTYRFKAGDAREFFSKYPDGTPLTRTLMDLLQEYCERKEKQRDRVAKWRTKNVRK